VSIKLPITVRWSHKPGLITVELPGIPFIAVVERSGIHLTVMLTRTEGEQRRAGLTDVLAIRGDDDWQCKIR
jgi:hypothetical protein